MYEHSIFSKIQRQFRGQVDAQEHEWLVQWRSILPDNESLFQQQHLILVHTEPDEPEVALDLELAWKGLLDRVDLVEEILR